MGGGKQKAATNVMIEENKAQADKEHGEAMGRLNPDWDKARGRGDEMYNTMYGGYNRFAGGGDDFTGNAGGGGGGGGGGGDSRFGDVEGSYRNFMGGGGVDTGQFNRFQGHLGEIAGSGGWSPERVASMDRNIGGYKDIARTGGIDAAGQARMRGGGVFDEFAKTGGYSEGDISNIRQRSGSVIPAYYQQAKQDAARQNTVQGGYGPGQSALFARMGRDQARGAQSAALDTELGIRDKVNAGRQWGSGAMADSESGLQGMMSGNRLAALGGASSTEANMVNSIAQNRMGAANAGAGNETGMQGVIQRGKMFGTSGLEGMAESAASRGAAASANAAANDRWRAEFNREGRQYGLSGMNSLYGTTPAEQAMYINANQNERNLNLQGQDSQYQARLGNKRNIPWGQIAAAAGTVALAASDVNIKTNIEPVTTDNIVQRFRDMPISTWSYLDSPDVKHIGPMAQDMQRIFGVGDGKMIALVDVMGLLMLLGKAVAEEMET